MIRWFVDTFIRLRVFVLSACVPMYVCFRLSEGFCVGVFPCYFITGIFVTEIFI